MHLEIFIIYGTPVLDNGPWWLKVFGVQNNNKLSVRFDDSWKRKTKTFAAIFNVAYLKANTMKISYIVKIKKIYRYIQL